MGAKAHGRILFWEGASLWLFRALASEPYPKTDVHAHHLGQLTLVALLADEYDPAKRRLTGNFPQCFSSRCVLVVALGMVLSLIAFVAVDVLTRAAPPLLPARS